MASNRNTGWWEVGGDSSNLSVQRAKKCLDARQNNSILQEIGNFIGMRAKQGKGVVIMGDFNARIGEVVGDERGSRNRERRALIEWSESMVL